MGATSDTSSEVTAIRIPSHSRMAQKSAKLRAYAYQVARPLLRRFKSQNERSVVPRFERPRDGMDPEETASIRSAIQLRRAPSPITKEPISPLSPASGSTAVMPIDEDRAIRAEQDAALEQALKADREFIERLREERRREEERERQLAEQEERRRIQEEMEEAHRRTQNHWRRWARRALIPSNPEGKGIEIAVRLPSGRRRVDILPADASLEVLHTLVETFLIPDEHSPEDDPEQPPEGYTHRWEFVLVTTNERVVLPKDCEAQIGGLDMLRRGVLLIVEEVASKESIEDGAELE